MPKITRPQAFRASCMRLARIPLALLLVVAAGGCQSYERHPVDIAGHHTAFLARSAESPEVAAFAMRMAQHTPSATVFDPTNGVSLAEAEVIALVFSADLHVARQQALLCLACAGAAGAWEDPVFGLDMARIVESVGEPWKLGASVGFSVPISGRLRLDKMHAEAEQAAEVMRAVEIEWQTRMNLRREWTRWSALDARASVGKEALARLDEVVRVLEMRERAGEIGTVEANVVRIERVSLSLEHEQVLAQSRQSVLNIKRLMGLAPTPEARFEAWGVDESHPGVLRSGEIVQALTSHNPRVGAMNAQYEVAERLLEWEVRKQYPDIEISPGFGEEDGLAEVRLGIGVRLPIFNRNKRAIAEAQTDRDALRLEIYALFERVVSELASAELTLEAARVHRASIEQDLVPLVDAQARMVKQLVALGEAETLIVLDSLQREREAKDQLIQARERVALAAIDIAEIAGPDVLRLSDSQGLGVSGNDELMERARREAGCACPDCVAKAVAAQRDKVPHVTPTQLDEGR